MRLAELLSNLEINRQTHYKAAMARLYFDYNATTPLAPAVSSVLAEFALLSGNPSSTHTEGRKVRKMVDDARSRVARELGALPEELIFTSGATEANNWVFSQPWSSVVITSVEHDSVMVPAKNLKKQGSTLELLNIGMKEGIDWEEFDRHVVKDCLVSVMAANNEDGRIFPIKEIARRAHQRGAFIHTDSACSVGKIPVDFRDLGVDYLSFSSHKFYGLSGCGGLIVKHGLNLSPFLCGGGQERGLRAGTENVLGILTMPAALDFACAHLADENRRQRQLRKLLLDGLRASGVIENVHEVSEKNQLPGTVNVAFKNIAAQTLIARLDLDGVGLSSGSACHSGTYEPSRVLKAMGYSDDEIGRSLRLSFGRMTREKDIRDLLQIVEQIASGLKALAMTRGDGPA